MIEPFLDPRSLRRLSQTSKAWARAMAPVMPKRRLRCILDAMADPTLLGDGDGVEEVETNTGRLRLAYFNVPNDLGAGNAGRWMRCVQWHCTPRLADEVHLYASCTIMDTRWVAMQHGYERIQDSFTHTWGVTTDADSAALTVSGLRSWNVQEGGEYGLNLTATARYLDFQVGTPEALVFGLLRSGLVCTKPFDKRLW